MKYLVGYTGFVGSNLYNSYKFDKVFNSKNIEESYGTNPNLLVYSGVPAQKFLANKNPKEDMKIIQNAIENIKKINPKKIVLISTIDVYKNPVDVNEDTIIETNDLQPYGYNRYELEKWVKNNFSDYLIVRLPGLYGKNIKKNFIYDLINFIPTMLNENKFNELVLQNKLLKEYYSLQENGFYKLIDITDEEKKDLKKVFEEIGFSALNFTDSRGIFQFYNLKYLWKHIQIALENDIKILNISVEPISISELYEYITNKKFENVITDNVPKYDYKTKYFKLFNGNNGYIYDKNFIKEDIKKFVGDSLR